MGISGALGRVSKASLVEPTPHFGCFWRALTDHKVCKPILLEFVWAQRSASALPEICTLHPGSALTVHLAVQHCAAEGSQTRGRAIWQAPSGLRHSLGHVGWTGSGPGPPRVRPGSAPGPARVRSGSGPGPHQSALDASKASLSRTGSRPAGHPARVQNSRGSEPREFPACCGSPGKP